MRSDSEAVAEAASLTVARSGPATRREGPSGTFVAVRNLVKHFPARRSIPDALRGRPLPVVRAVDDVSFEVDRGEAVGLVGESGCGKTTTGMILTQLVRPTSGRVGIDGLDPFQLRGQDLLSFRRRVQMIFQDPYETLDPRFTVGRTVAEPLVVHRLEPSERARRERVAEALRLSGLTPDLLARFPHELSGGQRQRVAIARAMVLRPELIVADEPVSMLDVSVRAGVMNLMKGLKEDLGVTFLLITHDLAIARYLCERIVVMYLGRIVEIGPSEDIMKSPIHPYSRALLAAVPVPDPRNRRVRAGAQGEPPDALCLPRGCRFRPRCPHQDRCEDESEPILADVGAGRRVACHLSQELASLQASDGLPSASQPRRE